MLFAFTLSECVVTTKYYDMATFPRYWKTLQVNEEKLRDFPGTVLLCNFTGGVTEEIDLTREDYATSVAQRQKLFSRLFHFMRDNALMAAEIPVRFLCIFLTELFLFSDNTK